VKHFTNQIAVQRKALTSDYRAVHQESSQE
jgi:hypothetical protein